MPGGAEGTRRERRFIGNAALAVAVLGLVLAAVGVLPWTQVIVGAVLLALVAIAMRAAVRREET
jgi:hypothetical protein